MCFEPVVLIYKFAPWTTGRKKTNRNCSDDGKNPHQFCGSDRRFTHADKLLSLSGSTMGYHVLIVAPTNKKIIGPTSICRVTNLESFLSPGEFLKSGKYERA
jgi:hypothetical protein